MVEENIAVVKGRDLPISTKHSIEICNFIRNKTINTAKKQLNLVLQKKLAIPARRFNDSRGHRKGKVGPGFYPEKATKEIIDLLSSLEANINNIGLISEGAYLCKVVANRASRPMHHGRQRRRVMKRTHIEFVAKEKKVAAKEKPKEVVKKEPVKEVQKAETKKEAPKEMKKEEKKVEAKQEDKK
ncbi:MAG: 50S ribosomal protein L22 [Candidatus Woesearchaeota archaeon]